MNRQEAEKLAKCVEIATVRALTAQYARDIIKAEWDESLHPRDNSGRFCAADGTGGGADNSSSSTTFGGASTQEFSEAVGAAKISIHDESVSWRVTEHSVDELEQHYQGAKLHITEGGSTVAVTTDGDIISVCGNKNDSLRGKDLLKLAVDNGGTKLDAYSGLYGFYRKCGFEPVSWCKFDERWAPKDWNKKRDDSEPIIFWKYTGNFSSKSKNELEIECIDFCREGTESSDYDEAQAVRDRSM